MFRNFYQFPKVIKQRMGWFVSSGFSVTVLTVFISVPAELRMQSSVKDCSYRIAKTSCIGVRQFHRFWIGPGLPAIGNNSYYGRKIVQKPISEFQFRDPNISGPLCLGKNNLVARYRQPYLARIGDLEGTASLMKVRNSKRFSSELFADRIEVLGPDATKRVDVCDEVDCIVVRRPAYEIGIA